MSGNMTDDAVSEYLREVERRLADLPVLQRRELLADLRAHIATERLERSANASNYQDQDGPITAREKSPVPLSEGEVLEILERLGSPEEVAAAAYEEAGPRTTIRPAQVGTPSRSRLLIGAGIVAAIILALIVFTLFFGMTSAGVVVPATTSVP
jgi:uncharacterized membrane protein